MKRHQSNSNSDDDDAAAAILSFKNKKYSISTSFSSTNSSSVVPTSSISGTNFTNKSSSPSSNCDEQQHQQQQQKQQQHTIDSKLIDNKQLFSKKSNFLNSFSRRKIKRMNKNRDTMISEVPIENNSNISNKNRFNDIVSRIYNLSLLKKT
jgi:predicted dehydrogenase